MEVADVRHFQNTRPCALFKSKSSTKHRTFQITRASDRRQDWVPDTISFPSTSKKAQSVSAHSLFGR